MKKKLKVAVIGLGMGRAHLNGFKNHDGCEVVALSDINEQRLKDVGDQHGIEGLYTDYKKMLKKEKPDIVSVATPNFLHKPITIDCFKAGAHVLCEKPMAMNAKEGRAMLAAAKKYKKRLMINFSFRFKEQSWAVKKQVEAGMLGDIYFGRTVWNRRRFMPGFGGWFGTRELSGGGPLIDLGVHRLDLALWMMGYPRPDYVFGSTYNHIGSALAEKEGKTFDVEDLACAKIKFKNGASLLLEASWAGNFKERENMKTRLLGTKGGVMMRNLDEGYADWEAEFYIEKEGCHFDMKLHDRMNVPGKPASSMAYFADAIINKTPHIASGEEGLIVMEILDALYKSAETSKPVKIT